MTQNEVDILKNSVLDGTEAYVEARLQALDYVKTQIGVVVSEPEKRSDRKYYHVVRCNATQSNPNGITYNNVLSVGNIPFPTNSVVFLIAPNAQYSNQFILGKLDDTPCNISAGSITLGDAIFLTSTPTSGKYGHIAGFYIFSDKLTVGDAMLSENIIGCGKAADGIVNMVGGSGDCYVQISDNGSATECIDGIRIYGWKDNQRGLVRAYDTSNHKIWEKSLINIPDDSFGAMLHQFIKEDGDTGYLEWK